MQSYEECADGQEHATNFMTSQKEYVLTTCILSATCAVVQAPGGRHYATYSEYDGQKFFYPSAFSDWKYAGPMVPQSDMEALFEMADESCMYEDDFWEAEGGMDGH